MGGFCVVFSFFLSFLVMLCIKIYWCLLLYSVNRHASVSAVTAKNSLNMGNYVTVLTQFMLVLLH